MRRAGLGEGAPSGNYGYTNSGYSVYEEENERLTESLRTKVSAIKSLSIEIGTEVKNQNKLLSEMIQHLPNSELTEPLLRQPLIRYCITRPELKSAFGRKSTFHLGPPAQHQTGQESC